ncbi:DUF3592 domain-containing protein [Halomonas organivorans]
MPDIAPVIALASGVGALAAGRSAWRRRAVNAWPSARARVDHTEVEEVQGQHRREERDDRPRRFLARVHYTFEVEGVTYRSDNGRFDGVPAFASRQEAEAHLARTPPGSTLTIRHAPDDPELTQLGERRLPLARLGLAAFLLGLCAMALWLSLR